MCVPRLCASEVGADIGRNPYPQDLTTSDSGLVATVASAEVTDGPQTFRTTITLSTIAVPRAVGESTPACAAGVSTTTQVALVQTCISA